jgi:hypothetical protein
MMKSAYTCAKKRECSFGYGVSEFVWKDMPKSSFTAKESFDVRVAESGMGEVVCSAL